MNIILQIYNNLDIFSKLLRIYWVLILYFVILKNEIMKTNALAQIAMESFLWFCANFSCFLRAT
jgi:hypothetical protein